MERLSETMMALIGVVLGKNGEKEPQKELLTDEFLRELYKLSKAHDLAHIVGYALSRVGVSEAGGEAMARFKKQTLTAIYRYEQLNYEYEQICETLEGGEIRFMPLKGSLLRKYYPEPWMRTSCDIDVLVDEENLDRAIDLLCSTLGYRVEGEKNFHDISLFSESGVHLELHFNILENMEGIDTLLARVWEYGVLEEGKRYQYGQTPEYLIFHILAHAYYHFSRGGCGVRTIIDLYLLKNESGCDRSKLEAMCAATGLESFARASFDLSEVWLGGGEHTDLAARMEKFILRGGAYGTQDARVEIEKSKNEGKLKFLLFRIFMPYSQMRSQYPVLVKHKWLYPVCLLRRWCRLLFGGRLSASMTELKKANSINPETQNQISSLMSDLGIK